MVAWPIMGGSPPHLATTPQAALVLIDVQQGFDSSYWGTRNNPDAEDRIAALLAAWRQSQLPIYHVQHLSTEPDSPLRPQQPGVAFKACAQPSGGESIIQKSVNSAFIGTPLERQLREDGIQTIVLVGFTTDHCVSTTTRMAANLGFEALVVADATATFNRSDHRGQFFPADLVHSLALASLHREFARVVETSDVLLADGSLSPAFAPMG